MDPTTPNDAIAIEAVSKTYETRFGRRRVQALRDVSLHVERGAIFGLLGPNGAGKTTLLKILLGLVRATQGSAFVLGIPVADPHCRRAIGYLPENHRFPSFLTAWQFLDLYGQMGLVHEAARAEQSTALLTQMGLADWGDAPLRQFSKGMLQRLGLAQALLNRPDLVFLDEPTDGVDPLGRRQIRDVLLALRAQGTTVFLNSHLLSEVEQVCTHVAILNRGRLVRTGPMEVFTQMDRIYEITCTRIDAGTLARYADTLTPVGAPDNPDALHRYRLAASERSDLNAFLDLLRSEGVLLEAIHPARRTLEDYFIEVTAVPEEAS